LPTCINSKPFKREKRSAVDCLDGPTARPESLPEKTQAISTMNSAVHTKSPIDFEQLVDVIGDAVVISDASGAITLWNPAAERMFGFSPEEALGNSLDLIIPERLRGRHWSGYEKTMATGETRYGHDVLRVPAVHKDGRSLSIAFTVALLHSAGPEKSVTGIVAVIRDETSRFTEERNLRKRLAELEAKSGA
jgi:PAS domain S-box-containing protein